MLTILMYICLMLSIVQYGILNPETVNIVIPFMAICAFTIFAGLIKIIMLRIKIPKAARFLIFLGLLSALNIIFVFSNDVVIDEWLSYGLRIMIFISFSLISFMEFSSIRIIKHNYKFLILLSVIFILRSLVLQIFNVSNITTAGQLRLFRSELFPMIALGLALPFIFQRKNNNDALIGKTMSFIIVFLSLVALIISLTRSFLIAVLISIIITLFLLQKSIGGKIRYKIFVFIIVSLVFVFIALDLVFPENIQSLILDRYIFNVTQIIEGYSYQQRYEEIKQAWSLSLDSPFIFMAGHGFGSEMPLLSLAYRVKVLGRLGTKYNHNFYAYLFYTLGILGLSMFLGFTIEFILALYKKIMINISGFQESLRLLKIGIFSVFINSIIISFFSPIILSFTGSICLAMIVGLGLGSLRLDYNKLKSEKGEIN